MSNTLNIGVAGFVLLLASYMTTGECSKTDAIKLFDLGRAYQIGIVLRVDGAPNICSELLTADTSFGAKYDTDGRDALVKECSRGYLGGEGRTLQLEEFPKISF